MVFSDRCPRVGLLDHVVVLLLVFLRKLYTIFHSGCTKLHSHRVCKGGGSHFSTPYTAFIICRLFNDGQPFNHGHPGWYKVVPHSSFDLHFSNNRLCLVFFISFLAIYISSLEKCLLRCYAFFYIELHEMFVYFGD